MRYSIIKIFAINDLIVKVMKLKENNLKKI